MCSALNYLYHKKEKTVKLYSRRVIYRNKTKDITCVCIRAVMKYESHDCVGRQALYICMYKYVINMEKVYVINMETYIYVYTYVKNILMFTHEADMVITFGNKS